MARLGLILLNFCCLFAVQELFHSDAEAIYKYLALGSFGLVALIQTYFVSKVVQRNHYVKGEIGHSYDEEDIRFES